MKHRRSEAPTQSALTKTRPRRAWIFGIAGAVVLLVAALVSGPFLIYGPTLQAPTWVAGIREGRLSSAYCISCHEEAGAAWRGSLHQLANQAVNHTHPGAGFDDQTVSTFASDYTFSHRGTGPGPLIRERRRDGTTRDHHPAMMIAYGTLRQFLVGDDTGRYQATEVAWDPNQREWFGVFGDEERNPGEWGHWTGQAMNWNSMCARCHMTAYNKAYDETADRYQSRWLEQGIGCVQCHGPMPGHEKGGVALEHVNISRDASRMIETCAGCHARAEELTDSAPPGANFEDHFRLQLMTEARFYYADGQILDEDFEWGSFRHSNMAAAGVTCLDCHNAHTGKIKLPLENNALCMQCHAVDNQRNAPVIDPVAHSFHQPESTGNRCVECHMAETTYMQRDPRRDHGFIIPDPLLNRELGIPDACSKCHADQSVDWNIEAWERWYGPNDKAGQRRERTRAVALAYRGDESAVPDLLRLIPSEKASGWRASLLSLAHQLAPGSEAVAAAARDLRDDPDPMIRAAAVRALGDHSSSHALVREALKDPVRLVRLDAEWALSTELATDSPERRELDAYLDVSIENPVALLRRGQDRFRRGRRDDGIADLRRAIALDPLSAPFPETLGLMLNATGRSAEAAILFEKAATLAPEDPIPPYYAALAWAEAGNSAKIESNLREAVRRDPAQSRAWYNLGLLLQQDGRTDEALAALATAERAGPRDADIPYAAATILFQSGRREEAVRAARRALAVDANYQPAAQLLDALEAGPAP